MLSFNDMVPSSETYVCTALTPNTKHCIYFVCNWIFFDKKLRQALLMRAHWVIQGKHHQLYLVCLQLCATMVCCVLLLSAFEPMLTFVNDTEVTAFIFLIDIIIFMYILL